MLSNPPINTDPPPARFGPAARAGYRQRLERMSENDVASLHASSVSSICSRCARASSACRSSRTIEDPLSRIPQTPRENLERDALKSVIRGRGGHGGFLILAIAGVCLLSTPIV